MNDLISWLLFFYIAGKYRLPQTLTDKLQGNGQTQRAPIWIPKLLSYILTLCEACYSGRTWARSRIQIYWIRTYILNNTPKWFICTLKFGKARFLVFLKIVNYRNVSLKCFPVRALRGWVGQVCVRVCFPSTTSFHQLVRIIISTCRHYLKKKKKGPLIASSNSWKITEEGNTNLWFCLKVLVITSDSVTVGGGLELQSVLQEHSFVSPHWLFGCSPHCQQLGGGGDSKLKSSSSLCRSPPRWPL